MSQKTADSSHYVDFTISATWHGLAPGSTGTPRHRRLTDANGTRVAMKLPGDISDADGRVAVTTSRGSATLSPD